MKNSKTFIFFLLFAANILRGQEPVSALFRGNNTPDSIVQITTVLPGATRAQTIKVEVTDGWARIEGDIVLGRIEELQHMVQDRGIVREGNQFRWPGSNIPYTINGGFTANYVTLIRKAIDYINGATHLHIRPKYASDTRWFALTPSNVCESAVGMQSYGGQTVQLMDPYAPSNNGTGCYFPQIVHEIAHVAGLWHEQSREDRNNWVTINWGNIQSGKEHNFNQHIFDGIDIGPYDFASDMHYDRFAFSKNGQATITANGGQAFGNASEYSAGDVAAINWLYSTKVCVANYNLDFDIPSVSRPLHYEVSGAVTSKSVIPTGNQVIYDAGKSITLAPGFQAASGCTFRAIVDGCGGGVQSLPGPDEQEWILEAENHQHNHAGAEPVKKQENTGHDVKVNITPNPFTTNTTINYTLLIAESVDLQIFNAIGTLVAQPFRQEQQDAGQHNYTFEASNLPPGVYFLVLHSGEQKQTKRLVLSQ